MKKRIGPDVMMGAHSRCWICCFTPQEFLRYQGRGSSRVRLLERSKRGAYDVEFVPSRTAGRRRAARVPQRLMARRQQRGVGAPVGLLQLPTDRAHYRRGGKKIWKISTGARSLLPQVDEDHAPSMFFFLVAG